MVRSQTMRDGCRWLLACDYDRLRKANWLQIHLYQIIRQKEVLRNFLSRQKWLEGEVHHRVRANLPIIISRSRRPVILEAVG